MRELSADRPDKTESAYTVDAGHFQVEMDLVAYSYDHDRSGGDDTRTEAWAIAPMNLKLGLLNDVDLQLMIETYNTGPHGGPGCGHDRAPGLDSAT